MVSDHGDSACKTPSTAPSADGEALWRVWRPLLSMDERVITSVCSRFRARAMQAARSRDHDGATHTLRQTSDWRRRAGLGPLASAINDTLDDATAAYIEYRRAAFDAAREHLYRALATTNRILTEHGAPHVHERRVHLAINLVRLEARRGDSVRASELGAKLLEYLDGSDASWPLFGFDVQSPIATLDPLARSKLAAQVLAELARVAECSRRA